jgi:protein SSD1
MTDHNLSQFMLLANVSVAAKVAANLPEQALLRRHEPPLERRLEGFTKRCAALGIDMDTRYAGSLHASFEKITDPNAKIVASLLGSKAMVAAKYFCAGVLDIAQYSHYALNVPLYTHFTSPIR